MWQAGFASDGGGRRTADRHGEGPASAIRARDRSRQPAQDPSSLLRYPSTLRVLSIIPQVAQVTLTVPGGPGKNAPRSEAGGSIPRRRTTHLGLCTPRRFTIGTSPAGPSRQAGRNVAAGRGNAQSTDQGRTGEGERIGLATTVALIYEPSIDMFRRCTASLVLAMPPRGPLRPWPRGRRVTPITSWSTTGPPR